jgi:hypothetical protein
MHTEPESAALAETAEFPIQDLSAAPATEAGAANGSGDRAARPNDPAKAEPKTNGATAGRTGFPPPVRRPMAERSGHSEPVADKAAAAPVTDLPLPAFAAAPPKRSRKPLWGLLAVGVGLALGAAGYEARVKLWLQAGAPAKASPDPKSAQPAVSLGLNTIDLDGQLQIRWDQNSPAILSAASGALEITDGGPVQALQLDQEQLRAGIQTYARRGEKVGVTLIVNRAEGSLRETTGFFGKLPEPQPPEPSASDRQRLVSQRDELMRLNARLRADLAKQTERALRAELAAEELRRLLRAEQRRRPENPPPAAIK